MPERPSRNPNQHPRVPRPLRTPTHTPRQTREVRQPRPNTGKPVDKSR